MGDMEMIGIFKKMYKGKRILITGDTGFKGSWLSLWLHELGADIVGYALPPKRENDHFNLLKLGSIIHHVDGDIRDYSAMQKICGEFKPELLFHLAAQALVRLSYEEPKYTFDTNVGGSVNVLEVVRNTHSIKSLIYVTSDKCYKNKEWTWGYRENDELGGDDPYSASKAAAELVFAGYKRSFFAQNKRVGIASVRAGNVIGGGDWSKNRIVPDTIIALRNNEPAIIRNPASTRPWQHVLEPLSGYLKLAALMLKEPGKYSGSWNFGPKVQSIKTVKDLTEKIVDCWGKGEIKIAADSIAPHEAGLLHLNCDKSNQLLEWFPRWDFDRAVLETVSWYKKILNGSSAVAVSKQQILDYMEVSND